MSAKLSGFMSGETVIINLLNIFARFLDYVSIFEKANESIFKSDIFISKKPSNKF